MKKYRKKLFLGLMTACIIHPALAQYSNNEQATDLMQTQQVLQNNGGMSTDKELSMAEKMWPSSSPFMLYYENQTLEEQNDNVKYKCNFTVGLTKRHTYYLHKKAIANMVKFGIDACWFDISFTQYAKGKGLWNDDMAGNVTTGTYANYEEYFKAADEKALDENSSDIFSRMDLGKYQIMLSVLGIGPSVKVAPFYYLNKPFFDTMKLGFYFHYVPSFTTLVFTGDDDSTVMLGYMGCWRFGGNLSLGRFAFGIESQWGSGTLKRGKINDDSNDNIKNFFAEKIKYKQSGLRFYLAIGI